MNVGVAGKKYGLLLPKKKAEEKEKRRPPIAKPPSVFAADEDDDVETEIARQASKKKSARDLEQMHAKALEQDPSIFDYDGVYDEIKDAREKVKVEKQAAKQPKYIAKLMEKAKEREMERDIIFERQLIKERAKEDHMYGDKERFVTSSYKRKLAEQAKWLVEEKQREQREAANEVTKKGDMSDFYRNLLSKNVAFGAKPPPEPAKKTATPVAPPPTTSEPSSRPLVTGEVEDREERQPESGAIEATANAKHKALSPDTRSGSAEARLSEGQGGAAGTSGRAESSEGLDASRGGGLKGLDVSLLREREEAARKQLGLDGKDNRPGLLSGGAAAGAKMEEKGGGGEKGVDPVAAARERYLARKKMKT